ncbi:DUF3575 domain-containing protein [uncultured Alistipes sp.]|uniref:DUF3575 domain-containing protein n=1 Tax=uncultured Alistipes sp. TaxID=538949 RepID=UPI0025FC50D4|nr:DUF3575 domain-containing protein [uncultured Alistipes sp.]
MLTAVLAAISAARAQSAQVSLPAGEMTVEESLRRIEEQTGYRLTYSRSTLDVGRNVRFAASDYAVEKVLEMILTDTGLWYTIQGKYIIIQKGKQPVTQRPVQKLSVPTVRAGETYVRTNANMHNNVNRRRPAPAPRIQVVDTTTVIADNVRSKNTDLYTSHIVPLSSYTDNRLPRFAIKTNLLHGIGALTPNLGIEFGLGGRTSLEISGGINPWRLQSKVDDNKKLAHLYAVTEFRWWTCERFIGHFLGAHAFFTHYNVGSVDIPLLFKKEYRYDGIGVGGGISYGYFLPLSKRWGIEFNVGVGVMWMDYDRFSCEACEKSSVPKSKVYVGPTRAGITLVFNIK